MPVSYKSIGSNIKAARKKAGLTQEAAAELAHLSLLHYGRLERGARPIALKSIEQIAAALGVFPYRLLLGCFPGAPEFSLPDSEQTSLGERIDSLLMGSSDEARRLIHDIAWLIKADFDL